MADQDDPKNPSAALSKLKQALSQHQDTEIDQKTQAALNTPFNDPMTSHTAENKAFLENLIQKINSGEINLLSPSSIIDQDIYSSLSSDKKAKADLFVNNTLFAIRRVYDFYNNPFSNESDMMIQMVIELRQKIDTLEQELGNVLKI